MIINLVCGPALVDLPFASVCARACVCMLHLKVLVSCVYYALYTRDNICMTNCESIWHGVLISCTFRYFQGTVPEEVERGSASDFSLQVTFLKMH